MGCRDSCHRPLNSPKDEEGGVCVCLFCLHFKNGGKVRCMQNIISILSDSLKSLRTKLFVNFVQIFI